MHAHNKRLTGVALILVIFNEWRKGYFKGLLEFLRSFPIKFYALHLPLLPLTVLPIYWMDPQILGLIQSLNGTRAQIVFDLGTRLGESIWVFLVTLYVIAFFLRRADQSKIIFTCLLGTATTGLAATIFKMTFLRARPLAGLGPNSFFNLDGLLKDNGWFQSFPSGDVAIVAGAAGYLGYSFKNPFLRWLVWCLPLCTACARISLNRHWPSDAMMALMLGAIVTKFLMTYQPLHLSFQVARSKPQ